MTAAISAQGISKCYRTSGRVETLALEPFSAEFNSGEIIWIRGESGSGKSTLLNICGLLTRPTTGTVSLMGREVTSKTERERDAIRGSLVGFVFQSHNLIPYLTVRENISLCARNDAERSRVKEFIGAVDLGHRADHRANTLSGGESQRVAVARAMLRMPAVLLADEPVSGLDAASSSVVLAQLRNAASTGSAVIIASHQEVVGSIATRIIHVTHGRMRSDR